MDTSTIAVTSGDAEIAVTEAGDGDPLVLMHGFASEFSTNWEGPGWLGPLADAGFSVFAPDMRGHGRSTKFHDEEMYGLDVMAADVAQVIETRIHETGKAAGGVPVMGYSMGAFIAAVLAATRPDLVSRAVLAGVGENVLRDTRARNAEIADGLLARDVPDASRPVARQFRLFADQTGSDRKALAACIRTIGNGLSGSVLGSICCPVLVLAGETDEIARNPQALAERIPGALCEIVPRRDHMRAVGDKVTKQKAIAFLREGAASG